jgi:Rieske Fe-S protein
LKESEFMDMRHPLESPVVAAPTAAAETPLGTAVPALLGTRRDFCLAACQALSLGAIAATIQACGGGGGNPNDPNGNGNVPTLPTIPATVTNGAATVPVGGTALAAPGGAATVTSSLGTMLVVRKDATNVVALTATCTHEACTITGFTGSIFQCPCHGSQYDTNGSVVRGPAARSLRQFSATLANDVITITV